ncbi:MAG TPA: CNNM domain-containing protein, partial [Candidatus Limnocylindrales bacterium]
MDGPALELLIIALLIFLNAVFVAAEIALVTVRRTRIDQLIDEGRRGAVRVRELTAQPGRFLAVIQLGITFIGFLAAAFAGASLADGLVTLFAPLVSTLTWVTRRISRLFRADVTADERISSEELRLIIEQGGEQGILEAEEEQMIHAVIELGDQRVHEVMVPRIAMTRSSSAGPSIRRGDHPRVRVWTGRRPVRLRARRAGRAGGAHGCGRGRRPPA